VQQHDALRSLICGAIAALAKQMTGLPVVCQIQLMTQANALYGSHVRVSLLRIPSPDWQHAGAED